jgi:dephospho-CoA kinase
MNSPIRLGLTGGIGSGKSTVARFLAEAGAAVVDADAIARESTAPMGLAMPAIADFFGPDFVTSTGALDREKMRQLIYSEPAARKQLESIIHPLVKLETENQAARATSAGHRCIVFDIPLLVESGTWRRHLDHVLVVDCTPEIQIKRVLVRNQLARAEVEKIIESQATREHRLSAADMVIENDQLSLEELAREVNQLIHGFGLSSG